MNIGKYVQVYSEELLLKNYSHSTIKNYSCQVELFLKYYESVATKPSEISEEKIKKWLLLANSINGRKHRISALKLFYKMVVRQPLKFKYIEYPRSETKIPQPLSEHEVQLLFSHCFNLKHKTILSLLFMCGLRVSEVINLKLANIDRTNMVLHIQGAKGHKDRIVPINTQLLALFEKYYKQYLPVKYLFNGQFTDQYSQRSVNEFIKQIGAKAGIKKHLHSHLGRHSCFSQMLANGVDMAKIQTIAGHNNIKTTQIYAKTTPFIIQNTNPYQSLSL